MKDEFETRPWRAVVASSVQLHEGRGSVLGPDTSRRTRWWDVLLECGHRRERTVRYRKRLPGERGPRARRRDDVLPAPTRLRCDVCKR